MRIPLLQTLCRPSVLLLALSLGMAGPSMAADTSGLDLTIQVLGAEEPVSDQAHRIPLPGMANSGGTAGTLLGGKTADGKSGQAISVAPVVEGLQEGVNGILQNPVQGTVNTVEGVTGGLLDTLGLGARPQQ